MGKRGGVQRNSAQQQPPPACCPPWLPGSEELVAACWGPILMPFACEWPEMYFMQGWEIQRKCESRFRLNLVLKIIYIRFIFWFPDIFHSQVLILLLIWSVMEGKEVLSDSYQIFHFSWWNSQSGKSMSWFTIINWTRWWSEESYPLRKGRTSLPKLKIKCHGKIIAFSTLIKGLNADISLWTWSYTRVKNFLYLIIIMFPSY